MASLKKEGASSPNSLIIWQYQVWTVNKIKPKKAFEGCLLCMPIWGFGSARSPPLHASKTSTVSVPGFFYKKKWSK